jgi:hypothetical protein
LLSADTPTRRALENILARCLLASTKARNLNMLAESEWTRDDRLRQPVFLGIREDKNAKEVVREQASYVGLAAQKTSSNDLAFCNRAKDV